MGVGRLTVSPRSASQETNPSGVLYPAPEQPVADTARGYAEGGLILAIFLSALHILIDAAQMGVSACQAYDEGEHRAAR